MPDTPTSYQYYPSLSNLISAQDLPDFLSFIKQGIEQVLDKIYYKDFQMSKSFSGSSAFYSLSIVSRTKLALELPGTGIFIVLNPDFSDTAISAFPITVFWEWKILKYLRAFNLDQFSFSPEDFFYLGVDIAELDSEQAIILALDKFVIVQDSETSGIEQFVNDINIFYSSNIQTPPDTDSQLSDLVSNLQVAGINVYAAIFNIYILAGQNGTVEDRLTNYFSSFSAIDIVSHIKSLIFPNARMTLALSAGIEFPRYMLQPVYDENGYDPFHNTSGHEPFEVIPSDNPNDENDPDAPKLTLLFAEALFYIDTKQGIGYEMDLVLNTNVPAQIGNTGLIIDITNLKLDLSTKTNIAEADSDNRPNNFVGAYAEQLKIVLPKKWFKKEEGQTLLIVANRLLVGTGGVSGTIALVTENYGPIPENELFWFKIGGDSGFSLGFRQFDITFEQNKVISSNIQGKLEIKKFTYPSGPNAGQTVNIDITGHLSDDGDFNLTASAQPPYPISFQNVFTYQVKTVELGKEDDDFYIGTSGTLQFEGFLKDNLHLGPIEIERLRIYSDGSFEFIGGSVQLIKPIVLPLGPVEITVSAIHYGSIQKEVNGITRKFNYFGFDGGVSIDPFGIEVRGDGVKYYYCVDEVDGYDKPKPYLHIQTLHLDLTLPANSGSLAQINGWIDIPEPGISKEYAGGVTLQIPSAKIAGKADIRLAPKYPAFIVDCEIEPTIPISLGSFAIYGFRGLLGYRYVAEKEAVGLVSGENTWYEYYKYPKRGINIKKFSGPEQTAGYSTPISLGAGATLGTGYDDGYTLSIKAMALFSIPSLFMIDGRAAILAKRLGLDESSDPPFFAFVAVGDDSLEFGFGADYKLPGSGDILKLYADIQAGFFFKNQRPWYINIGTNINPIQAEIIRILTLKSYLMMSARGIEAGSRGEFKFDRNYGVIKVKAEAFIEVGGRISFEKPQFGAYLMAGVKASVKVLFMSISLEVGILFGVEAPKPFLIYGKFYFKVKVGIRIFGKRITLFKFSGNLEVVWNFNKNLDTSAINPLIYNANDTVLQGLVEGVNMLSAEKFELKYLNTEPAIENMSPEESGISNYIIPLDTYIDIKTEKGLLPGNAQDPNNSVHKLIGGINNAASEYMDLIPPVSTIRGRAIRQVAHQYSIEELSIKFWNPSIEPDGAWDTYHPYEALYPNGENITDLKVGQFQKADNRYNALRILATTPFSYTEQGQPGWYVPEQYGINASTLFCEAEAREHLCADFLQKSLNAHYYCNNPNTPLFSNNVAFSLIAEDEEDYAFITDKTNAFGFAQSLAFDNRNSVEILLPNPTVMASLKISNTTGGVRVKFYSIIQTPQNNVQFNVVYGNPNPDYYNVNAPYEIVLFGSSVEQPINYNRNPNNWDEPIHPSWRPISKIVIEPIFDNTLANQASSLEEQIAVIENNNNLISLGLIDGEILSSEMLEEELHEITCGATGHSVSFINRYYKKDALNYYYSKEFTERGSNFIYSVGTTEKKGLVTKVAENGSVVWEKSYTLEDGKDKFILKRIIQINNDKETDKSQYILHGNIGGHIHYLLSIDNNGEVIWCKRIEWEDIDIQIHIAPAIKDQYFYLILSDRNEIDTNKKPFISKVGLSGDFISGTTLDIQKEEFIINSICETSGGLTVAGRFIEGDYNDSVGTIIELDGDLQLIGSFRIDKYYTTIHDIEVLSDKNYLISGYDNKQDGIFIAAVGTDGMYASYHFPNTKNHRSVVQVAGDGYYLLADDDQNGVIHFLNQGFDLQWSKEINIGSLSNGIRNFTYNRQTNHITLNCFNQSKGSLVVHTNRHLHSCYTNIFEPAILTRIDIPVIKLSVKQEKMETALKDWPVNINRLDPEVKEYCPGGGCEDPDAELCDLNSQIKYIYLNQLVEPAIVSNKYFDTAADSFKKISNEVVAFNPKYELAKKFSAQLKDIELFLNKRDFDTYVLAWNGVVTINTQLNLEGNCTCDCSDTDEITMIHQVCWMSSEDYVYNINIPSQAAIAADAQATVAGVTQYIQPIWRPDTSYYIHFVLKDVVGNAPGTGTGTPYPFTYGFTTGGPVGYFHTHQKATYGDITLKVDDLLLKNNDTDDFNTFLKVVSGGLQNQDGSMYINNSNGFILEDTTGELRDAVTGQLIMQPENAQRSLKVVAHPDQYPLTSLKQYIDYNRSYPNADGNLLSAKPLFYADYEDGDSTTEILIFFSKTYATHFFQKWAPYKNSDTIAGRLKIVIKDPTEGVEIINPPALNYDAQITTVPQSQETWYADGDAPVPFSISNYLNLYNAPNCIGQVTIVKPASAYIIITPRYLKPNKLYTVIVNNIYDVDHNGQFDNTATVRETREVHSFVFKTSRYRNFSEQINSFNLEREINGSVAQRQALFTFETLFTSQQIDAAYAVATGQAVTGFSAETLANLELNYQHPYDKVFEGIFGLTPWDDPISTEVNILKDISTGNIIGLIVRNPEPFNNPRIKPEELADTLQVMASQDQPDDEFVTLFSKDNSQALIMNGDMNILSESIQLRFQLKISDGSEYIIRSSKVLNIIL